ncbi:MAG: hypothetical protein WCV87_03470, partial [Candidatus Paceibacterota bacterium]
STCGSWGLPTLPSGWQYHCSPTSSLQSATGTGWIPVNFKTTGVVSLSSLPTDPINASSTGLYYTYVTGGSFELTALMESAKYKGINAVAGIDGGKSWNSYEIGSNLSLAPIQLLDGHSQDSSLVGWWPLNEGIGTSGYDQSGNGRTMVMATTNTTLPQWITCPSPTTESCINFDGLTNYGYAPPRNLYCPKQIPERMRNNLCIVNRKWTNFWDRQCPATRHELEHAVP